MAAEPVWPYRGLSLRRGHWNNLRDGNPSARIAAPSASKIGNDGHRLRQGAPTTTAAELAAPKLRREELDAAIKDATSRQIRLAITGSETNRLTPKNRVDH